MSGILLVSEREVVAAMRHYEAIRAVRDGVTLGREVSMLADLLGEMWFARVDEAAIPDDTAVADLLRGSGIALRTR